MGWPGLLEHPFVKESSQERLKREAALADAAATAHESRAWKGEGGAVAGCQPINITSQASHADVLLQSGPSFMHTGNQKTVLPGS